MSPVLCRAPSNTYWSNSTKLKTGHFGSLAGQSVWDHFLSFVKQFLVFFWPTPINKAEPLRGSDWMMLSRWFSSVWVSAVTAAELDPHRDTQERCSCVRISISSHKNLFADLPSSELHGFYKQKTGSPAVLTVGQKCSYFRLVFTLLNKLWQD